MPALAAFSFEVGISLAAAAPLGGTIAEVKRLESGVTDGYDARGDIGRTPPAVFTLKSRLHVDSRSIHVYSRLLRVIRACFIHVIHAAFT